MTTLNPLSTVGTTAVVLQSDLNDDWTYMAGSGHYLTADLLAALDAVPVAERDAEYRKYAQEADRAEELENQLDAMTAERDALAATIERVREAADHLARESEVARVAAIGLNDNAWSRLTGRQMALYEAAEDIHAALAALEPFILPTEVPARIIAVKRSTGCEKELTLFTDGDTTWWADIDDWGPFWTRSQVMDQFTNHRLLPAADEDGGDE